MFEPFCHPEAFPYPKAYGNFDGPFSIRRRCLAGEYQHNYILNYTRDFLAAYDGVGRFGIDIFMEGHEGTMEVIRTLDHDLAEFIKVR